jgi:hypothetical protein
MKAALKRVFSKRAIVIVLAILLIMTSLNTYFILEGTRSSYSTNPVDYDYVVSKDGENYLLKNMLTGYISSQKESASTALTAALSEGKSVYFNPGTYTLTNDVYLTNKINAKIDGEDATINGNGHKIVIYGDNYTASQYATVSGLTFLDTTLRVENSLGTTITNSKFINCSTAIEFADTQTWSEYNKIENCQFINNTQSIAFRTPVGSATGSYASSQIERCSFNIKDYSTGIVVEDGAQFSDSQLQNLRFWMGENGRTNQTALFCDGSMDQTLLLGVVFESFTDDPNYMFAIDIGANCNPAPTFDSGVSFLGSWTARVHNPEAVWLRSSGSVFERQVTVPVGTNGQYSETKTIDAHPLTIGSFTPQINVKGNFAHNETITVRIRVEYIDNVVSTSVTRTFNSSSTVSLSSEELMTLFPSQSIIWSIMVDAKTAAGLTDATVTVSGYGTTG